MKDTQFMTADEKEKVLGAWKRFVSHGFKRDYFTKSLYSHLTLHCSFIAHYNIDGFYRFYFTAPRMTRDFMHQFDERHGLRSAELGFTYWYTDEDYGDLNQAMIETLRPFKESIYEELKKQAKADIKAEILALKKRLVEIDKTW